MSPYIRGRMYSRAGVIVPAASEAPKRSNKKAATKEMVQVLWQIILKPDHANSLLAAEILSDLLTWKKTLGADLTQENDFEVLVGLVVSDAVPHVRQQHRQRHVQDW